MFANGSDSDAPEFVSEEPVLSALDSLLDTGLFLDELSEDDSSDESETAADSELTDESVCLDDAVELFALEAVLLSLPHDASIDISNAMHSMRPAMRFFLSRFINITFTQVNCLYLILSNINN